MNPRISSRLGAVVAAASVVGAAPARAQVACDTLPKPVVVSVASDFEPTLRQLAVKLAAESPALTVVAVAAGGQSTSCAAITGVVNATDFGGLTGRYYVQADPVTISAKSCTFPAGQTADLAISEVFYETCAQAPQPKPDDVVDVLGPAQSMVFVVPKANTRTQYLTYDEARTIYGCGVSDSRKVAGFLSNPTDVFCRDRATGVQITLARNLGLAESTVGPGCSWRGDDDRLLFDLIPRPVPPCESGCDPPAAAIGLVNEARLDSSRDDVTPLAFKALGQSKAYYPDSALRAPDRANVRDGHYPLWGYLHLIAKKVDGNLRPQASELIGWLTEAKTSAKTDFFPIAVGAGYIPQCAMKVKRSSDGGLLGPYSPAQPCRCAYEALATRSIPPGCTPCPSASACACGQICRHGFCE
jgi:hypothetical protein